VDEVIEKTQSQINKLQDLKKGTMNELLTKGIGHTEFKDSPVGKIPKGWRVVNLEQISTKITDGEHQTPNRSSSGFYLLSARNIQNGFIALNDVDFIPEDEYQRISNRVLPKENDILISCSGSVGRCSLVPKGLQFSMVRSVVLISVQNLPGF
jgi:type I restriction enzyme S subunit